LALEKDKNASGLTQSSLKNHFTAPSIHKEDFENNYLRWLVNECQPLHTGESSDFHNMILGLNLKGSCPHMQYSEKSLHLKKLETE